ncbi:hypothetical protein HDU76_010751, partial [Blyttiomyces sp. JEL0837]
MQGPSTKQPSTTSSSSTSTSTSQSSSSAIITDPTTLKSIYDSYLAKATSYYNTTYLTALEYKPLNLPTDLPTRTQISELLLLLTGNKPAVLICPNYQHIRFAKELVDFAIRPILGDLPAIEILPCDDLIEIESGANFKGQYVIFNKIHPTYAKAKNILSSGKPTPRISKREIGIA